MSDLGTRSRIVTARALTSNSSTSPAIKLGRRTTTCWEARRGARAGAYTEGRTEREMVAVSASYVRLGLEVPVAQDGPCTICENAAVAQVSELTWVDGRSGRLRSERRRGGRTVDGGLPSHATRT